MALTIEQREKIRKQLESKDKKTYVRWLWICGMWQML